METGSDVPIKKQLLELADRDPLDLRAIASLVTSKCNLEMTLNRPKNTVLRFCGQDGTVYAGNKVQLKAWKEFYLPEKMEMEVIGAIDNFPCDAFGLQLVVLLCENGNVYAHEDEVLHLVAMTLGDLFKCGIRLPGHKTFKLGKCFKELTVEEYNNMMESEEIKTMRKAHQVFRDDIDVKLLNTLDKIKQRRKNHLQVQKQRGSENITSSADKMVQEKDASGHYNADNGKSPTSAAIFLRSRAKTTVSPEASQFFDLCAPHHIYSPSKANGEICF